MVKGDGQATVKGNDGQRERSGDGRRLIAGLKVVIPPYRQGRVAERERESERGRGRAKERERERERKRESERDREREERERDKERER